MQTPERRLKNTEAARRRRARLRELYPPKAVSRPRIARACESCGKVSLHRDTDLIRYPNQGRFCSGKCQGLFRAREHSARPPDPITELSNVDLAYIAGIVDGEGHIGINSLKKAGCRTTYYPVVAIGMTYRPVIEWLQSKLQSRSVRLTNPKQVREKPHWKVTNVIRFHGKRAQVLCKQLSPFLIVKKAQAEIVCAFPQDHQRGSGYPLDDAIQQHRVELSQQIRVLNRRGREIEVSDGSVPN